MSWKNDQVTAQETAKILELAKTAIQADGDFVEFGCYKGDTSLLLAELLVGSPTTKKLWLYDSFEGLPVKSHQDDSALGASFQTGELSVTKREVKQRFLRAGLPVPIIKKAWFSGLTPTDLPSEIAFAFLDGDFYESIRDSLNKVAPRMSQGGIIVIHDYTNPALPGVHQAVEEWQSTRKDPPASRPLVACVSWAFNTPIKLWYNILKLIKELSHEKSQTNHLGVSYYSTRGHFNRQSRRLVRF